MPPEPDDALAVLVHKSGVGDAGALAELRQELPNLVDWAGLEVLAHEAREGWADATAGGDPVRRAACLNVLVRAAARLARTGAGSLERLLAGLVALADARLDNVRRLSERAVGEGAPPFVVRDLACRVKRAERDTASADRTLRAFQQRLPPHL